MPTTVDLGTVFKGSPSGKVVEAKGGTREIRPNDAVIDIVYSGLCGTDLHFLKADMVLGHEGVGVVSQVGPEVKAVKVGDRVGWGYNHKSCDYCDKCWQGLDTLCPERTMYGLKDLDFGSFGDRAVIDANYVHKIPDSIPLRLAGPLQCGGATVYGAMEHVGITPNHRVGVLGLGGLGHLAVQYLAQRGCDVVVFSGSNSKREQAMQLGANEFVAVNGRQNLSDVKQIDTLLVTTSAQPNWDLYISVIKPNGTIVPLSVSDGDLKVPYQPLLFYQLSITTSLVAPRLVHRQMLEFTAHRRIMPMVEELQMTEDDLNTGMERLAKGDVRYRFVFKNPRYSGPAVE